MASAGFRAGQPAGGVQRAFEIAFQGGIGRQLVIGDEVLIVDEELRLQDVQAVEFRKQVRGRVRRRPHGVSRVQALPFMEGRVRLGKFQVVHLAVSQL